MDNPKISVVIPVYNAEKYIAECLESVLGQTFSPYEIIVCDDASTDGTKNIVKQYAKRFPELIRTIFHRENQGAAENFNSGLKAARGDYVSMVAGDDYWMPTKLEMEIKALMEKGTKWAYSKVVTRNEFQADKLAPFEKTKMRAEGMILFDILARRVSPRNFLVERSIVEEIGFFSDNYELYEDWDFKIKLSANYPVAFVDAENIVYRINSGGLSMTDISFHWQNAYEVLIENRNAIALLEMPKIHEVRKIILKTFFKRNRKDFFRTSYWQYYIQFSGLFKHIEWINAVSSKKGGKLVYAEEA